jgi:glutathione S-transferase
MAISLHVEPHFVSPYVFACFVALREKKQPFEIVVLDATKDETRKAEYLSATVTGRVPSLVHDDFGLAESTAIIEYLEEVFPEPRILPRTPRDRARCRQIMSWLRSDDTQVIRDERPASSMFFAEHRANKPLSERAAQASRKLFGIVERLVPRDRPNLFPEWCIADAELAFILHRLILNDDPVPGEVRAWAAAQWQRPSVREYVGRERPKMDAA